MSGTFTDDDIGKTVENANGDEIGTVTAVDEGTVHVVPTSGVMGSIKAALGWNNTNEDTVSIQRDAVTAVTDDAIRLEGDTLSPEQPQDPGETPEAAVDDTGGGTGVDDTGGGTGVDDLDESSSGTEFESDDTVERDSGATPSPKPDAVTSPTANRDPEGDFAEETDGIEEPEPTDEEGSRERTNVTDESELTDELNRGAKVEPPDEIDETDVSNVADETSDPEGTEWSDRIERSDESNATEPSSVKDEWVGTGPTDEPYPVESEGGAERTAGTEGVDPADVADRGVDLESLEETDPASKVRDRPDGDVDRGTDLAAESRVTTRPTDVEVEVGEQAHRTDDESRTIFEDDETKEARGGETGHQTSSGGAMLPPHLAAINGGLQVFERGLAVQQNANELIFGTLEGQASLQRQSLELFRAATHSYFDAASAVASGGDSRGGRRSTEEGASEFEAKGSKLLEAIERDIESVESGVDPGNVRYAEYVDAIEEEIELLLKSHRLVETETTQTLNEFSRHLSDQLERTREMRERLDEGFERRNQRSEESLERQIEEVERLQRKLNEETERMRRQLDRPDETAGDRRSGSRLERIDGIDTMFRERLEEAGIGTPGELARADPETVADAAGVTRKRAESWVERAAA